MARLRSWQQTEKDDCSCRRVHSPIPPARAAKQFCPYPPLRFHGKRPASRSPKCLSPIAADDAGCAIRRRRGYSLPTLSQVPCSNDGRPTTQTGRNCVEIDFQMLCRYFLMLTRQVAFSRRATHVRAEVCLRLPKRSEVGLKHVAQPCKKSSLAAVHKSSPAASSS